MADTDLPAPLGRRVILARRLVTDYAILNGTQRAQIVTALDDALDEIRRLAQALNDAGNPHGYRRTFPTPPTTRDDDATRDEWRAEMTRTLAGTETLAEAIGIAVGAASACWDNPRGAGTFESDRARVLVEVLTDHVADTLAPTRGHAEFAAEVRRLAAQSEQRARNHLAEQLDKTRAERDLLIRERDQARGERDRVREERDQYRNGAHNMAAENARFVDRNKALTEQLAQRDTEITKRADRNRELRAEVETITHERNQAFDARDQMRAERDKAWHQLGRATDELTALRREAEELAAALVQAQAVRDVAIQQRDQLAQDLEGREPRAADEPEPDVETRAAVREVRAEAMRHIRAGNEDAAEEALGAGYRRLFGAGQRTHIPDSWLDFSHEREQLAAQLAATPGPVLSTDDRRGWVPLSDQHPGPRPGPTPAVPSAIGHSPSLHMLGACPCQAGTPFDPDYTEADLDPATAADEETPV